MSLSYYFYPALFLLLKVNVQNSFLSPISNKQINKNEIFYSNKCLREKKEQAFTVE